MGKKDFYPYFPGKINKICRKVNDVCRKVNEEQLAWILQGNS